MPPDRVGRDDLEHALEALASETSVPTVDAASLIARGRRRIHQRRAVFVGVVVALVAAVASVGVVSHQQHHTALSTPTPTTRATVTTTSAPPTTSTPLTDTARYDPPPIEVTASETWICGDPFQVSASGGPLWNEVRIPAPTTKSTGGEFAQPTLCTAAPGAAWLLRATGNPRQPELVRVRAGGGPADVFPFDLPPAGIVESIAFIDPSVGWAVIESGRGDPVDTVLYGTDDGGKSWGLRNGHAPIWPGSVDPGAGTLAFVTAADGWALGVNAPLEQTHDGGTTWQPVTVPEPVGPGDLPVFLTGVFAYGNNVVAWGGQSGGMLFVPFFDVSTDRGRTWTMRSGPNHVELAGTAPSTFVAADGDHWLLGTGNQLYATDDGGRTWALRAEFAGIDRIQHVAIGGPAIDYVSADGALGTPSSVVLSTTDAGSTWTLQNSAAPPLAKDAPFVNFPGGIIGCPTQPLTPVPAGNPPAGLEAAALAYVRNVRHYDGTVSEVYRVGTRTNETYASIFAFHVPSCGQQVVDTSWVVELYGPAGSGGGGSTPQAQIVFAHYADGWHAFGAYH
jgi:photosystem II stability/assembly factor-like uncharacterized protein